MGTEQINLINTKSVDTWQSIDNIMSKHNETISSINNLIGLDKQKIEDMETELKELGNTFSMFSPEISKTADKLHNLDAHASALEKKIDENNLIGVRNTNNIKEIVSKISSQENRLETFDNESESSKSRITKINEHVESIHKTITIFESRHSETIEKIKEVTVLAGNIDTNVKAQEQRMEQQKANDFNQFNNQLEQLKRHQEGSSNRISYIDADHRTLIEKLILLEDAHQNQLQKAAYIENLGDRVNRLDEMRQQSEAKAKDEVDATISQSNRLINTIQTDFEEKVKLLEKFVNDEQRTLINKSQEINQEILAIKSETNAFSQKVEGFSKDHQIIINNIEERVKQNEDQIKHIDDTLDGLNRTVQIIDGNLVNTAASFSNELDQKLKEVDNSFKSSLSKYESINRDNFEKIETQIQESTYIQAEKVQYVESLESKVNQMSEEHLKLEKQTREDLKASIENNTKQILNLKSEIDATLSEVRISVSQESDINKSERDNFVGEINNVNNNIDILNQQYNSIIAENIKHSEDKLNEHEELIQNSLVNYQDLLEGKLREVGEETKMNSKSLVEIEPLAKSIDSRLVMLQNSNAEKMEVLKEQILVENTHRIESFRSEVSTSLVSVSEKNESVEKHIQVFKDSSDKIKSDIQDMVSKEQESHQNRLSALLKENESVTNNLKLKLDEQLSVISDKLTGTQEKIDSFHSDISSLENKVHNIETSDSKQNALLSKLEDQTDNLDVKLSSLESADLFLQEAHRMHTEKALDIEKECKRMEQTFVQFYKDQRQDIDSNIKVDINNLLIEKKNAKEAMENVLKRITSTESRLKEIEHYTQNTNETIVLNMKENLEKLENSSNQRATDLENTVIKYYEQIGSNSEKIKEISSISSNLESKLKNLSDIVEENKTTQNQFESDQREQYQDVDNKIVMVINDKFENLQTIISSYESKNKDTIQNIHDLADRASNMEDGIEKKFSVFNEKLTEHSNKINSLQESNTLQNQKVGNFEGLSDKVTQVEDSMKVIEENLKALMINISKNDAREKKIDDSMMAIMEQANATLINDAQQDSQIKTLEIKNRSLEDKLSSLESADLFLQESYRQLSDKTVKIESDFRKSDDNLNFLYKQQHEEIEGKIKGQITDIYFEINELQQEKVGMNEKIDEMENNMEKNK